LFDAALGAESAGDSNGRVCGGDVAGHKVDFPPAARLGFFRSHCPTGDKETFGAVFG
jgi:hypothetical protein